MSISKQTAGDDPPKQTNAQASQLLQAKSTLAQGLINLQNISTPGFKSKYDDLPDIIWGLKSTLEWSDAQVVALEGLDLMVWDYEKDKVEIAKYLNTAIETMTSASQVTTARVAVLMVCAWNMASCNDPTRRLFSQLSPLEGKSTSLEDLLVNKSDAQPRVTVEAEDAALMQQARRVSYLCGSLLRMVVKEEDNILRAWSSICHQYGAFYGEDIAIRITPDRSCLQGIRNLLQNRAVLRNTIAAFVLEYTKLEGQDQRMCEMLYARDMCFTGMHAYRLLLDCADRLKVPVDVLAAKLEIRPIRDALHAAVEIYKRYDFPLSEEDKKASDTRKTWRYARIFDETVFAVLRTKNCETLVALLAMIDQKIGGGCGDATKIKQIAGYVERRKEWLSKVADNIIRSCREEVN